MLVHEANSNVPTTLRHSNGVKTKGRKNHRSSAKQTWKHQLKVVVIVVHNIYKIKKLKSFGIGFALLVSFLVAVFADPVATCLAQILVVTMSRLARPPIHSHLLTRKLIEGFAHFLANILHYFHHFAWIPHSVVELVFGRTMLATLAVQLEQHDAHARIWIILVPERASPFHACPRTATVLYKQARQKLELTELICGSFNCLL